MIDLVLTRLMLKNQILVNLVDGGKGGGVARKAHVCVDFIMLNYLNRC